MQRVIVRAEEEYAAALERARSSLKGKWVRDRTDDTGEIEEVHLNSNGVSCTILWQQKNRRLDQKFSRDFFEW